VKPAIRRALCVALFLPAVVCAQNYPAKPVRLVVAFPAGGGIDTVTRLLGPKLADALGQQMVIDNPSARAATSALTSWRKVHRTATPC